MTKSKTTFALATIFLFLVIAAVYPSLTSKPEEPTTEPAASIHTPSPYKSESDKPDEWLMAFHDLRHTGYTSARPPYEVENVYLKWKYETGSWVYSSPAVADIDGDGETEVVFGSSDNNIYALSGENGELEWTFTSGGPIFPSPALVYSDGEFLVFFGDYENKVYALSGKTGAMKWSRLLDNKVLSSPAIADIDQDGYLEVLFGTEGGTLYSLLVENGDIKWTYNLIGYRKSLENGEILQSPDPAHHSSPAIADYDGDGELEVVTSSWGGMIYYVDGKNGQTEFKRFPSLSGSVDYPNAYGSVSLADVNGDGVLEGIIGTDENALFIVWSKENLLWEIPLGSKVRTTPSITDLDNDGNLEIVVGLHEGESLKGGVAVISAETASVDWVTEMGNITSSSPVIADIDGDDELEIVLGADDGKVYCFDGKTGSLEWTYATNGEIRGSLVVADIDGDQIPEILVPSYDGNLYVLSLSRKI